MKNYLLLTASAALLAACASTGSVSSKTAPAPAYVAAAFETPVMASVGDSADDPAIYIGENGSGFIAGTDKQAGLYIYNLDGSLREFMKLGTLNNVDLRTGFSYKGVPHVLLVASNDEINTITTLLYNPATDTFIQPEGYQLTTGTLSPYGICLGTSVNGTYHAGLTTKAGIYEQHIISEENGIMQNRKVREFSTGTKTEGCAFDDRTGTLYIAEEEGGLYRYPASPSGKDEQIVIARVGEYGTQADLEGVTVYEDGADGGYLLVSSQGNNSYAAFSLPDHQFAGRFGIEDGVVDGVSTTDGIAVTSTPTARFPKGFLVVQDDMDDTSPSEPKKKQNFKVIDWADIETLLK
ncbi:MAG: phytase [Alphaproteobacteria bacterium]